MYKPKKTLEEKKTLELPPLVPIRRRSPKEELPPLVPIRRRSPKDQLIPAIYDPIIRNRVWGPEAYSRPWPEEPKKKIKISSKKEQKGGFYDYKHLLNNPELIHYPELRTINKALIKEIEIRLIACMLYSYPQETFKKLIDYGGLNVNRKNNQGNTVLHSLVMNCANEIPRFNAKKWIFFFVENGAKLLKNNNNETPLTFSNSFAKPELKEYLNNLTEYRYTQTAGKRKNKKF